MAAISPPHPPLMSQSYSQSQYVAPEKQWKYCVELQSEWSKLSKEDKHLVEVMTRFRKNSAITFVWVADQLDHGRDLNSSLYQSDVLSQLYDSPDSAMNLDTGNGYYLSLELKHHLMALMHIMDAADQKQNLSEELILSVHREIMEGYASIHDTQIKGGNYRIVPASIGCHIFPDHISIPMIMRSIVGEYNGFRRDCDMFERASWLLLRILSLHPFDDKNGRVGRLLWCFSLLRDGLPFISIPQTDRDKYVKCIIEDSRMLHLQAKHMHSPCLTSLTVSCVKEKWENFLNNLSLEYPYGYSMIQLPLEQ